MSKADIQRVRDYLEHVVEAIERIHLYVADTDEMAFMADNKTRDAVIRNFEIIGEASHKVELHHAAFAAAHPEVPWLLMYTMRNRVAHGYFQEDYEMVWKAIHGDLPELHATLTALLADPNSSLP